MSKLLWLLVAVVVLPAYAAAQEGALASISMEPAFAAPGSSVQFTVSSTYFDLGVSAIQWSVDGAVVQEGAGVVSITTALGAAGESTDVSASIVGPDRSTVVSTTVTPASVDLLWESRGLTPPFYAGRALASPGTKLVFVALPTFSLGESAVPAQDLSYTWRRGNTVLGTLSGRGKSSISIDSPLLFGSDTISVEVRAQDGVSARASVRIASIDPALLMYESHPLFGILFHQALPSLARISDTERTIAVYPFFSPAENASDSDLDFEWRVNRRAVAHDEKKPYMLTINAAGSTGVALIELDVGHKGTPFYSAQGAWQLIFNSAIDGGGGEGDPFAPQQ